MKKRKLRPVGLLLAVLLTVSMLTGCHDAPAKAEQTQPQDNTEATVAQNAAQETTQQTEATNPKDVFWIVTDMSLGKPMAEKILESFQAAHPDLQIKLQTLSSYDPSMTEGYGPDVFLLPAAQKNGEPLFVDVNLAMRDDAFADISTYYDADKELGKEDLVTAVMDAGMVDGARYVLPLRYDMPVLYVDTNQLAKEGGTIEMLGGTIGELYDAVLASDNPKLATAATVTATAMSAFSLNFYPEFIDYDTGEILLTAEDMMPLLQSIQNARAAEQIDKRQFQNPPTDEYLAGEDSEYWNDISCYYIGGMDDLLSYALFTCAHVAPGLTMLPVTAVDGSVVADVTYYGAVSADSKNPELAYEFLRWFLTEEGQWQENEDLVSNYIGWPVRAKGDVTTPAQKYITYKCAQVDLYCHTLNNNGIGELPILDVFIDRVQFATNYELEFKEDVVDLLNDSKTGAVQDADIIVLLQAWLEKVQQHLAKE